MATTWTNELMRSSTRNITIILVITVSAAVLSLTFIHSGYRTDSDTSIMMIWAHQFVKDFQSGVLYPQWAADVNYGCGSPVFIFYPPMTFYTYALLSYIIQDIPLILSLSSSLGILLSGFAMYILSRRYARPWIALVSAVIYMALPFRLYPVYQSSAMATLWSFVWMPLILRFFVGKMNAGKCALLALSYAVLVLTNLPATLLFSAFLTVVLLAQLAQERSLRDLAWRSAALALGYLISSVFLLPVLLERGWISLSVMTSGHLNYAGNFVLSPGSSVEPIVHWTAAALSAVFIASLFYTVIWRRNFHQADALTAYAVAGLLSILMSTAATGLVWRLMPVFQWLQFPQRFLMLSTVLAAVVLAGMIEMVQAVSTQQRKYGMLTGFSVLVIFNLAISVVMIFSYGGFGGRNIRLYSTSGVNDMEQALTAIDPYAFGLSGVPEYKPRWTYEKNPLRRGETRVVADRQGAFFVEGDGSASVASWEPEERLLEISSSSGGRVVLWTFYYPRWKGYVDGQETPIEADEQSGLIAFNVPPGRHTVNIRLETSAFRTAGAIISALAFLLTFAMFLIWYLRGNKGCRDTAS